MLVWNPPHNSQLAKTTRKISMPRCACGTEAQLYSLFIKHVFFFLNTHLTYAIKLSFTRSHLKMKKSLKFNIDTLQSLYNNDIAMEVKGASLFHVRAVYEVWRLGIVPSYATCVF